MAMTKVKNLQIWCKRMADGYRDVEVRDMAASWKSGLAFCAIIHRFRPDLIDYDSLSKENVFENNQMAFEVAERELSIPAFLEAADMVAIRVPDRLSVVTYVSQYYNYFHDKPQLGGPDVRQLQTPPNMKANAGKSDVKTLTPAQLNAANTPAHKDRQESMGDKCTICRGKVYLLERHIENGKLFHRSCFRCSDHSPQSKVFKRHPFGSIDDDSKDTVQNKFRKIGTEQDSSSKNGSSGAEPDFWQRRARAKVKDSSSQDDATSKNTAAVGKYSRNTHSTTIDHQLDTPTWKKSKDVDMKEQNQVKSESKLLPPVKTKGYLNGDSSINKGSDRVGKPTNLLANKFKELEEITLKKAEPSKDKVEDKNHTKTTTQNSKSTKCSDLDNKHTEANFNINQPVAKPRQIKKQFEKMDTSEEQSSIFQPKPTPRVLKSPQGSPHSSPKSANSPHASPRNTPKSPPMQYKSEFSRPRTPEKHSSPLSPRKLAVNNFHENKDSRISAPPLPSSLPPSFIKTQPPKIDSSIPKSPHTSPRSKPKTAKQDIKAPSVPEPPRISANVTNSERSGSPMEAVTSSVPVINTAPSKAVIHEPKAEHTAVLVVPNKNKRNDETKNREIFGGLLKSLADVRTKYDTDTDTDTKPGATGLHHEVGATGLHHEVGATGLHHEVGATGLHHEVGVTPKVNTGANHVANQSSQQNVRKFEKGKITTKIETKSKEISKKDETPSHKVNKPARPKSSFVSGRFGVTETKTETIVTKTKGTKVPQSNIDKSKLATPKSTETTTTTAQTFQMRTKEDGDVATWKQQLDKRKAERERPKSADILGDRTQNENKPDWQKEAVKRIVARKGIYTDPEKVKISDNVPKHRLNTAEDKGNTNSSSSTNPAPVKPVSPVQRKVPEKKVPDTVDKHIPAVDTKVAIRDKTNIVIGNKTTVAIGDKTNMAIGDKTNIAIGDKTNMAIGDKTNMAIGDKTNMAICDTTNIVMGDTNVKNTTNVGRRIVPVAPQKEDEEKLPSKEPVGDRKKIDVGQKFVFDHVGAPKKPPRPPLPPSPKSPGVPKRPPPPKKESPGRKQFLTAYQIQKQLQLIDTKLTHLELKGRSLEDSIRNAEAEKEDDLMIGWFELVSEKNELVRKEADVIYLSREQELEDEQDTIDNQLQMLLNKPAHLETEAEQREVEYLIEKKLDVVNQRSYIIDSIDEDRLRYAEEDRDIQEMIKQKGFLKDNKDGNVMNKKKCKHPSY